MISHTISAYELLIIFLQVIDDYSYFCTINNTVLDKNLCLLVSLRLSSEYTLSQLLFFFLFDQSVLLKNNQLFKHWNERWKNNAVLFTVHSKDAVLFLNNGLLQIQKEKAQFFQNPLKRIFASFTQILIIFHNS